MLHKPVATVSPPSSTRKAGRGKKRRVPKSIGRYPFLTWSKRYLESSGLAEATLKERERRLRRINRDFQILQSEGKADTTNPEKMGEKEVGAFVDLITDRGLKCKTFEHEINALNCCVA